MPAGSRYITRDGNHIVLVNPYLLNNAVGMDIRQLDTASLVALLNTTPWLVLYFPVAALYLRNTRLSVVRPFYFHPPALPSVTYWCKA